MRLAAAPLASGIPILLEDGGLLPRGVGLGASR